MTTRSLRTALAESLAEANRGQLSLMDTATLLAEVIESWREDHSEQADSDKILLSSVVAISSGNPSVQCRVGAEAWQWDPEVARSHAAALLQCAEAAVHDAAMVRWMVLGPMGMDRDVAIAALQDLRRFRGDSTA